VRFNGEFRDVFSYENNLSYFFINKLYKNGAHSQHFLYAYSVFVHSIKTTDQRSQISPSPKTSLVFTLKVFHHHGISAIVPMVMVHIPLGVANSPNVKLTSEDTFIVAET
jgi:hypothetical protein